MQEVFLFPLAAGFIFAIGTLVDKFILENKMPNAKAYFFLQFFAAALVFPIFSIAIFGLEFPSLYSALIILFAAAFASVGSLIYFTILEDYDVSSVGPLLQSKLLFAIPLAFLFLNEFYGFSALVLMVLIFGGAILTTYSKKFSAKDLLFNNKLLSLAMLMGLTWAISDLPVKMLSPELSGPSFVSWRYFLSLPTMLLLALFMFKGESKKAFSKNLWRTLPYSIIAMLFGFAGIVLLFIAYTFSFTITSALVLSQAIFVFVLAFAISRIKSSLIDERHSLQVYAVRLVGVLLIISSIYFLISSNIVV